LSTCNRIGAAALAAALVFAPFAAAARAAAPPRAAQQEDTPSQAEQDVFNRGRALFAKGQYEQAATVFRDFLKDHPNSFIADLMLLWLGRSYIELGRFQEADQVAQRLRTIKDTPFVDIYESELQQAKTERPAAAASPRANASPTQVAQAAPTPARTAPAPRPTPTQIARNTSNTPGLVIRGEGNESRPRTTAGRRGARANSLNPNATAQPAATPTPQPVRVPRAEATAANRGTSSSTLVTTTPCVTSWASTRVPLNSTM